jgi:replicative DNA helicase
VSLVLSDKLPPCSLEAELAALGVSLVEQTAAERLVEALDPEDFYFESHRKVFRALAGLLEASQPVDMWSVSDWLRKRREFESVGGDAGIGRIVEHGGVSAHLDYYAEAIAEKATYRRLMAVSAETRTDAEGEAAPALELAQRAVEQMEEVARKKGAVPVLDARDWFQETIASVMPDGDAPRPMSTGWAGLDDILCGGLKRGTLGIVAGRPSMGKSALCNAMLVNAAKRGTGVLFATLEMDRKENGQRILAAEAGVSLELLIKREVPRDRWREVCDANDRLRELPLHVYDNPEATVTDIRGHARRLVRKHSIGLVVVDQLQTIQSPKDYESENVRFSRIAYALKALARKLNVCVILQAQLNRKVEDREDKVPRLSDLRDSGALENCADWVLLLYRAAYYRRSEPGFIDDGTGPIKAFVPKHRGGKVGQLELSGDLATQRIWEETGRYSEDDVPPEAGRGGY